MSCNSKRSQAVAPGSAQSSPFKSAVSLSIFGPSNMPDCSAFEYNAQRARPFEEPGQGDSNPPTKGTPNGASQSRSGCAASLKCTLDHSHRRKNTEMLTANQCNLPHGGVRRCCRQRTATPQYQMFSICQQFFEKSVLSDFLPSLERRLCSWSDHTTDPASHAI
jgi:hypothetical protein